MTDNNTLMKLEYLLATLEGEARFSRKKGEKYVETGIGTAAKLTKSQRGDFAVFRSGMAYAYDEAAKALIDLINDLKGETQ